MKVFHFIFFIMIPLFFTNCAGKTEHHIKIIAHRGGAELAPENTLAAFRNAIKLGVDMIEIDVHLSKDGHVMVIHDETLDRTTTGHDSIAGLTLAEIKKADAGIKFNKRFAGEKVPTLNETLETINGKCGLLIEIKKVNDSIYPGLEEKVVEAIHTHHANGWVEVQSFNKNSILKVKKLDPSLITLYLLGHNFESYYDTLAARIRKGDRVSEEFNGIAPHYSVLDKGKVDTLHRAGYIVYTWTVDKPEEMKKMIAMGVDGIITNTPDKLIPLVQ